VIEPAALDSRIDDDLCLRRHDSSSWFLSEA
jgi:hypothetical protein